MRLQVLLFIALLAPAVTLASVQPVLNNLPSDPRGLVLTAKKWDELSDKEKRKVKEAKEKYRKLPKEDRQKLREKWEKMPQKEREKYKLEKKYR
jgi:Protein of unknown function (DUF3106)